MRKKPVVLFLFLLVSLVLPFLFYQAWRQEIAVVPQHGILVENSKEKDVLSGEKEYEENEMNPAITASNSFVLTKQELKTEGEIERYDSGYVFYAPGVTKQMYDFEFWLEQCDNPKETIWTKEDITSFNQQVLNREEMFNDIFGQEFQNTFQSKIFDINKAFVDEKKVQRWEETGYGICVSRCEIKSLPVEEPTGKDPYLDENLLTTARMNSPVLVDGQTEDGTYYHVISCDCQGWAPADNIALCTGREEWERMVQQQTLIVTAPRLRLEISGELLTMGTEMRLLTLEEAKEVLPEERFWGCYAVELAGRDADGTYIPRYETIPVSDNVHTAYLEFTRENLLRQMFLFLGQAYGWGGSHSSVDCSGLVQDVMAVFGLQFPRNSKAQSKVPAEQIAISNTMGTKERKAILDQMNPGDLLYFPGHIMFYLGQSGEDYYVLNAVGSMKNPGQTGKIQNVRRVVINTLSMERKDGSSWMDNLETAILF